MDTYKLTAELKALLADYDVHFPYDPYGAIDLEGVISRFLEDYFTNVSDRAFDEGFDTGFNEGYDAAEAEYS